MSLLIDLEDVNALEKLGLALCKIPSVVTALSESIMKTPESRKESLNILFSDPTFRTYAYELYLTPANLEISKRIILTELI